MRTILLVILMAVLTLSNSHGNLLQETESNSKKPTEITQNDTTNPDDTAIHYTKDGVTYGFSRTENNVVSYSKEKDGHGCAVTYSPYCVTRTVWRNESGRVISHSETQQENQNKGEK